MVKDLARLKLLPAEVAVYCWERGLLRSQHSSAEIINWKAVDHQMQAAEVPVMIHMCMFASRSRCSSHCTPGSVVVVLGHITRIIPKKATSIVLDTLPATKTPWVLYYRVSFVRQKDSNAPSPHVG